MTLRLGSLGAQALTHPQSPAWQHSGVSRLKPWLCLEAALRNQLRTKGPFVDTPSGDAFLQLEQFIPALASEL